MRSLKFFLILILLQWDSLVIGKVSHCGNKESKRAPALRILTIQQINRIKGCLYVNSVIMIRRFV